MVTLVFAEVLIDWFIYWHFNLSRVIKWLEDRESHLLYVYIYIFCVDVFLFSFFFFLAYQLGIILKQIYLTHKWDPNRYFYSGIDLIVMAMKKYSTFSRFPELEHHHQINFNVIFRTPLLGRRLTLLPRFGLVSLFNGI